MTIDLQSLNGEVRDLKPPIPRDRLIFEAVIVQRRGQQEVAQEQMSLRASAWRASRARAIAP